MCTRNSVGNFLWHPSSVGHLGILLVSLLLALPGSRVAAQSQSASVSDEDGEARISARANPAAGKPIFERYCAPCHGISGSGGRGPRLNRSYLPHAPDDAELRDVITNGIPPLMPDASYLSLEEIANVAAHIRSLARIPDEMVTGSAARGGKIFARAGCSGCHIHNGQGVGFGPDLTFVGDFRSASSIKGIIRDPSSELPDGFLVVKAIPLSGNQVTGIRVNEDTFTIQIKDNSGALHSFRKKDLRELQRLTGKTPMPSFQKVLSPAQLNDLVAFLASSRQAPPLPAP